MVVAGCHMQTCIPSLKTYMYMYVLHMVYSMYVWTQKYNKWAWIFINRSARLKYIFFSKMCFSQIALKVLFFYSLHGQINIKLEWSLVRDSVYINKYRNSWRSVSQLEMKGTKKTLTNLLVWETHMQQKFNQRQFTFRFKNLFPGPCIMYDLFTCSVAMFYMTHITIK